MISVLSCFSLEFSSFLHYIQTSKVIRHPSKFFCLTLCAQNWSCTDPRITLFNTQNIDDFFLSFFLCFFPSAGLPVVYLAVWQKVDSDTGNVGPFWSERVRAPLESSPCLSGRRLSKAPLFAHAHISFLMSWQFWFCGWFLCTVLIYCMYFLHVSPVPHVSSCYGYSPVSPQGSLKFHSISSDAI